MHRIFALGDSALTIDFGNVINEGVNNQVLQLFKRLENDPLPGMIEAVPAYSSLTVYYDVYAVRKKINGDGTAYSIMEEQLSKRLPASSSADDNNSRLMEIPICYDAEFGPDLEYVAAQKNILPEEFIRLHVEPVYRVYMLGFIPGFPYMGEINEKIMMPRKARPQNVAAGSVGIAARQTGVYPFDSPGGWHIIGRTPLKLFEPQKDDPTLFKAGDRVKFISISKNEFANY
jgi:inhibitor of KinA